MINRFPLSEHESPRLITAAARRTRNGRGSPKRNRPHKPARPLRRLPIGDARPRYRRRSDSTPVIRSKLTAQRRESAARSPQTGQRPDRINGAWRSAAASRPADREDLRRFSHGASRSSSASKVACRAASRGDAPAMRPSELDADEARQLGVEASSSRPKGQAARPPCRINSLNACAVKLSDRTGSK